MKKICFITGTRADYGILRPVMRQIQEGGEAQLQVIATNMHLSPHFGHTVDEIENDGFNVDIKLASLEEGSCSGNTVRSMAKTQEGLADAFKKLQPDLVVILGDRYEALATASAAVVFGIPIAHLHGGETTEGAMDDKFRHAITKLADFHFAATPQYVEKIIAMGEIPERVFHSGAPGAEIRDSEEEESETSKVFSEKTGIQPWEPFILLAFHPVTMLADKGATELNATLRALDSFITQGYKVLVTMPNSDPGNHVIEDILTHWAQKHNSPSSPVILVKSLGTKLFHHAMELASAIVGNSSAALIEAPSHRLGAVNVGMRQKGRAHGVTVIDSPGDECRIREALKAALSMEMKSVLMGMPVSALNPYYKENSSSFIAKKLIELL